GRQINPSLLASNSLISPWLLTSINLNSTSRYLKNNIERWCCYKKTTCKSYIHLNSDNNNVVKKVIDHNHQEENELLNLQSVSNKLKRKAVDDICEKSIMNYINMILKKYALCKFFYFTQITKIFGRITYTSLDNMSDFLLTNRNENFLLDSNILLFSTKTNLMFLSNVETIFVDGTFKSYPSLFTQIFTVHGLQNDKYIPLFCLLPDKESKSYENAFLQMLSECTYRFADFEWTIHLAILSVWPSITLKGCRFHLGQSWYRKIQSIGLIFRLHNGQNIRLQPYELLIVLNAMFYNAHPNIFQFINTLKRTENRTTSIINKEQFLKQAMADFQ
ncbi:MULE domain-containing protein, partial [Aphis craccivora]